MIFFKRTKSILLILFLSIIISSCEDKCYESGEFFLRSSNTYSNPSKAKKDIFGSYSKTVPQVAEWQDTGLVSNGDQFIIAISGGWITNSGSTIENQEIIDSETLCQICHKTNTNLSGNCICAPTIDLEKNYILNTPKKEEFRSDGSETNRIACDSSNHDNPNICSCKPYATDLNDNIRLRELLNENHIAFPLGYWSKNVTQNGDEITLEPISVNSQKTCRLGMGFGLYMGLFGRDGNTKPSNAYHLYTFEKVCPIPGIRTSKCVNDKGVDKSLFIYRSPNGRIFENGTDALGNVQYHQALEKVKLTIYDNYYMDNSGSYKVEFMSGVNQVKGSGLLTDIIESMEGYLFGYTYIEADGTTVHKSGVVQFFYNALFKDRDVRRLINIILVLYITIYGISFFMGITDFSKKEILFRILKIGIVMLFTSPNAWSMYNMFVVGLFKSGMDSLVGMISKIFDSNMNQGLAALNVGESASNVSNKFIFIDNMIKNYTSKANITRIFGLFGIPGGKGIFAFFYVPIILFLIGYFIYTMLDIVVKYIINLLKICFGLALGPIFILFVLFEKTKDMFKNWLSFMGSRSLEIVILIAIIHPFILILDGLYYQMFDYQVCVREIETIFYKFKISEARGVTDRSLFEWFQFFLKIAALTFITKTIANKAAYVSGQLISIGGVSNADAVSEAGFGQSGFSLGGSIMRGALAMAKSALNSPIVKGAILKGARLVARNLTKAARAKIGGKSINDRINDGFRFLGIRNRGIRSYMRDSQVDKAISVANAKADAEGLTGKDRDEFVRNETMSSLNLFIFNNASKASALGLDNTNIMKRLDQKLVKEPMKQAMKAKANELKAQGIFGKEAREILRQEGEKWVKENSSISNPQEKVAEFFKKKSMQNYIRSQAEINSSTAMNIVKNLIDSGRDKEAKEFIDKFRDNANKNIIRNDLKKEETLKTGGKTGKILKGLVTLANATVLLIPNAINSARKGKIDTILKADDSINKTTGKVDNFFTDARRIVKGLKIPFVTSGGPKSNPKKNIRKFDRKFARMMNEKMQNADVDTKEKLKRDFDLKDSIGNKDAFRDRNILKVKDTDSTLTSIGKMATKGLLYPVIKPAEFLYKKYHTRIKGSALDDKIRDKMGYERADREKTDIDAYRNAEKAKSMNKLAQDEFKKLDSKLAIQIQKSKGTQDREETIMINGNPLKIDREVVVKDSRGNKIVKFEPEEQKVMMQGRKADTEREYDERIKYFEDSREFNKPVDNLKLILNDMDKRYHANLEISLNQNENKQTVESKESDLKLAKEKELQDLKSFDNPKEATIAEKLSKLEALSGSANHELKIKFQQEINAEIDKQIATDSSKTKELNSLKNALFDSSKLEGDQLEVVKNIYEKIASEQILAEPKTKDPIASSSPENTSASSSQSSSGNYLPENIRNDDSNVSKLIYEIYNSGKKIAEIDKLKQFTDEPPVPTTPDSVSSSKSDTSSKASDSKDASSGSGAVDNKFMDEAKQKIDAERKGKEEQKRKEKEAEDRAKALEELRSARSEMRTTTSSSSSQESTSSGGSGGTGGGTGGGSGGTGGGSGGAGGV